VALVESAAVAVVVVVVAAVAAAATLSLDPGTCLSSTTRWRIRRPVSSWHPQSS
jgi:hypothetical protein